MDGVLCLLGRSGRVNTAAVSENALQPAVVCTWHLNLYSVKRASGVLPSVVAMVTLSVDELLATSGAVATRSPETVAERRMPFYPVGSTQTYCISAINPVGYGTDGYVSDQVWRMGGGGGGRGRRKAGPWRRHVSQQHSPRCRLRTVRPTRRAHPLTSTGRASSPAAWFSTAPQATCRWWAFTSTTRSARASKR